MARRKKETSLIGVLITISSNLPWYVSIILAVIIYSVLSPLAIFPVVPKSSSPDVTTMIFPQIIFFLSLTGQFLLPLILCIGAGASVIKQLQKSKSDQLPPWFKPKRGKDGNLVKFAKHPRDSSAASTISNTPNAWSLELIKEIEWRSFEKLCAAYFLAKGYKVVETGAGKDGGVDLYLLKPSRDDNPKYDHEPFAAIQCKSWFTKQVGVKTVRELYGVMAAENIKLGVVVATGYFTEDAINFAKDKHLHLISGAKLLQLITALPLDVQGTLLKKMTAGDYKTPSCPTCDIKMVKRIRKKSNSDSLPFWGCGNFPKCRHIQYISK